MQNTPNDVWAVGDEPTSNSVALAHPASDVIALDEDWLDNASGGGCTKKAFIMLGIPVWRYEVCKT